MTSNAADLATLLLERREALIKGWVNRVLADPEVPEANRLTPLELRDHIPAFLDELARKMDRMTSANGEQRGREANAPATEHAKERYAERYTTMAALRELSHLRAVIIDLCFRERVVLDADTAQLLHAAVDAAMARAAAEIEAASHRALREEAAVRERFMAILGHDLRTPIGSIARTSRKDRPPMCDGSRAARGARAA
jgi:signal transduction histidine kinase